MKDLFTTEDASSIPSYIKMPVAFVKGKGVYVFDSEGNKYLDFYGGHCVASIGHSHPTWVEAISKQAAKLGFYSNIVYNDTRAEFSKRFLSFAPDHMTKLFLCNSGAEANETAIKLAMKATGRTKTVAMLGGFHGRTAGALSVTHLGPYREQFSSIVFDTKAVPFGNTDALLSALDSDTAAVILEPVQSMNGVATAKPDYFKQLVNLCHKNGTCVIFDEVQTSMGRLGAPFAADFYDVLPDIITSAKGVAGGFPIGVVLATDEISNTCKPGQQGTTFGGGPMACAAGLAVLDVIEKNKLVEHCAKLGLYAKQTLVRGPVKKVLGEGLLIGLETSVPAKEVTDYLFDKKIVAGTSSKSHIARLLPPLIIDKNHMDILAAALDGF